MSGLCIHRTTTHIDGGYSVSERACTPPAQQRVPDPTPSPTAEPSAFQRVMMGLVHQLDQGEAAANRLSHPSATPLSMGELLAVQQGIYRYSETMMLTSKIVESATTSLKTIVRGDGT